LGAFYHRSPPLEDPKHDLPRLNRFDLGTLIRVEHFAIPRNRSGSNVVCSYCGCLSIKVADPVTAADSTWVDCGHCNAFRGTLSDLHNLARRGTDLFEF
jgi:hypothetical protein